MTENSGGAVRKVCWEELLPWLIIFRSFGIARRVRMLLLAAAAIVLTAGGWAALGLIFPGGAATLVPGAVESEPQSWLPLDAMVPDKPQLVPIGSYSPGSDQALLGGGTTVSTIAGGQTALTAPRVTEPVLGTWAQLTRPFLAMFAGDITVGRFFALLVAGLWALAVWSFLGGAITRVAAVSLAGDEYLSWSEMMSHARSKWLSYFGGPLIPLVPVAFMVVGLAVLGMLLWTGVGTIVAALIWPLMLLAGLGIAVLLLGVVFGWPLMWATVSTEGTDGFDAVSRTYSYIFQRPLHYLFYLVIAVVFGLLCWLFVANFAAGVIALTDWSVEWGANLGRWSIGAAAADVPAANTIDLLLQKGSQAGALASLGAQLIYFWRACVKLLAVSFLYSYFWTAMTAVYLLLRRDVDATELDEVFLPREEESPEEQPQVQPEQTPPEAATTPAEQTATASQATVAETPGESSSPAGEEPSSQRDQEGGREANSDQPSDQSAGDESEGRQP